jgi:hypothetical protein
MGLMSFILLANTAVKGATDACTSSAVLHIVPAILLGLAIAFVELVFVHQDERGMGWLAHGLHAVPVTMIFTFITMNVPFVMKQLDVVKYGAWMEPVVIIIVGLVAMGKVLTAAAIAGKVGEKKYHVFVIGALIIAAPYAWRFVLCGMISPMLPAGFS